MAGSAVTITGDSSVISLVTRSLSNEDPLEFISGTFRSTPEERRVCTVFLNLLGATFELRFEFTSPDFVEHTITGAPTTANQDTL